MNISGMLLRGSVLLTASVLVRMLLGKRLSATSRHLLWTLAIVGLLVLPIFHVLLPVWTVASVATPYAVESDRPAESQVRPPASDVTSSLAAPAATLGDHGDPQRASVRVPWATIGAVLY